MIKLDNVSFSYGENQILKDFSLTIQNGECLCLSGASGCGKTTVARLILGLEKSSSGKISVPEKISCVFQEDRLIENSSVWTNIKMVLTSSQYAFADSLLKETNLYSIKKKTVRELSGGMKRRIAIIRAIAYGGDALILDEAFNGIDSENKIIFANIIKREFIDKKKPVLMVTHIEEDAKLLNAKFNKISVG